MHGKMTGRLHTTQGNLFRTFRGGMLSQLSRMIQDRQRKSGNEDGDGDNGTRQRDEDERQIHE